MRRYLSARCLALHVTLLVVLTAFAFLTHWQLDRALGGNNLSWAYTFEWPLFAGYAIYVWWSLVRDSAATASDGSGPRGTGRRPIASPADGAGDRGAAGVGGRSRPPHLEPGWALTGGRERNVAIAASTAVDPRADGRHERFVEQTPEEAAQLAAYNRYLEELAASDEASAHPR